MLTVGMLLLMVTVVLLVNATRNRNLEAPFQLLSLIPAPLFLVSFIGLRNNGNSLPFYAGFCLSLVLSLLGTVWGIVLIVVQKKRPLPHKLFFLSLLSAVPVLYVVMKTVIGLAMKGME